MLSIKNFNDYFREKIFNCKNKSLIMEREYYFFSTDNYNKLRKFCQQHFCTYYCIEQEDLLGEIFLNIDDQNIYYIYLTNNKLSNLSILKIISPNHKLINEIESVIKKLKI